MKKKYLKSMVAGALTLCLAIGFSGCSIAANGRAASNAQSAKIQKIKAAGKIVLGTSADYPPYEFHKEVNGTDTIEGFDISIANEVAKDLGVKLEIKDMSFDGLLAALQSGNVDFVVAGMTPTAERAQHVDFTNVYYKAVQSIIVRKDEVDKIKTTADLNGKKIGVQMGSIQEQIAKDQLKGAAPYSLKSIADLVMALNNNKVDAVIVELPVAESYVSKNSDLALSQVKLKQDDSGSAIAVAKGNEDLVNQINKTLGRLNKDKSVDKFVTDANNAVQ